MESPEACVNSNSPPILHRFRDMADYWSSFHPRQVGAVFDVLIAVNLYIEDGQIWNLKKLETSMYHMVQSIFRYLECTCDLQV